MYIHEYPNPNSPVLRHVPGTQFDSLWAQLFSMLGELPPGQFKDPRAAAMDVTKVRDLMFELQSVIHLNTPLSREQIVVARVFHGASKWF